jgi:hypothetical protein
MMNMLNALQSQLWLSKNQLWWVKNFEDKLNNSNYGQQKSKFWARRFKRVNNKFCFYSQLWIKKVKFEKMDCDNEDTQKTSSNLKQNSDGFKLHTRFQSVNVKYCTSLKIMSHWQTRVVLFLRMSTSFDMLYVFCLCRIKCSQQACSQSTMS